MYELSKTFKVFVRNVLSMVCEANASTLLPRPLMLIVDIDIDDHSLNRRTEGTGYIPPVSLPPNMLFDMCFYEAINIVLVELFEGHMSFTPTASTDMKNPQVAHIIHLSKVVHSTRYIKYCVYFANINAGLWARWWKDPFKTGIGQKFKRDEVLDILTKEKNYAFVYREDE